ncbi:MAG: DEDD exonuclease domain-containing protein [Cellulomonadaceae bacterium]
MRSAPRPDHFPGTTLPRPRASGALAGGASGGARTAVQPTLAEIGTPLSEVTFVVVDLETTGTSPATSGITEIGAVKVRGGQRLGEFQTFVNPGVPIPAQITRLTGISTRMVADAPSIRGVLPAFWEFMHGAVLVAHNARFDVGFLRAAAREMDLAWPGNQVVDTVALARRVVTRDEAPNHRLGTLAALFRATVTPDHRALSDARATVDVLHALLDRLAPWGVTHLEDLASAADPVAPAVRAKRHLAQDVPTGPGVYLFHGPGDEVLYVGTSTNLRGRVRSYFTASEKRSRMQEMLQLADRVSTVPCATRLEAQVRELRLIAEHAPRYNRRSKFPQRMPWLSVTAEPHPRLSIVAHVRPGPGAAHHIGPFPSRKVAQQALEALQHAFAVRQCTRRLPLVATPGATACALAEMGRCAAPCLAGADASGERVRASYGTVIEELAAAMTGDPTPVVEAHTARMAELAAREKYEEAAGVRDRLAAFLVGAQRAQEFGPLARCAQLVAARRDAAGGWEVVVVRHGRLAATAVSPPGCDPYLTIDAAVATAEHVAAPTAPATAAHPEETTLLLAWLAEPGVRLVQVSDPITRPVAGAARHAALSGAVRSARSARAGLAEE